MVVRKVDRKLTVSPLAYVWISRLALTLLCVIVVSGAAVRLTGSGLGCSDWPRCSSEKFVDVSTVHGAIEQVNRLFTGLVTAIVILAVLAARFRQPYRPDLVRLAWGLVAGVVAQIVLGGIVVLSDLNPIANLGHFLLSMALVSNALILSKRAADTFDLELRRQPHPLRWAMQALLLAGSAAIFTGTIVTGSGPHAGDEKARRLEVAITTVAKIHGETVVLTILLLLTMALLARHYRIKKLIRNIEIVIVIAVLQAVVGYVQYFNNIPALLVGIHVFGATMFYLSLVNLWFIGTQIADISSVTVERNSVMVS